MNSTWCKTPIYDYCLFLPHVGNMKRVSEGRLEGKEAPFSTSRQVQGKGKGEGERKKGFHSHDDDGLI